MGTGGTISVARQKWSIPYKRYLRHNRAGREPQAMTLIEAPRRALRCGSFACLCAMLMLPTAARAQRLADPAPQVLTMDEAVRYALENNPALAAQREQHGIAAAHVVIADTYPYNPTLENRIQAAEGPKSSGITNRTPLEHILVWPIELFHQGRYRREGAAAALSRTDWEIAYQEQTLAIQVIRAYTTLLYRQEKFQLLKETVEFNQKLVDDTRRLLGKGRTPADLIFAQAELASSTSLLNADREALATARTDLFRALGIVNAPVVIQGLLALPPQKWDADALTGVALTRRADLNARREGVAEAEANVRFNIANRWGNPSVGPAYTLDPTGVNLIGVQINVALPLLNTNRGDIQLSQAQRQQAIRLMEQTEVNVRQDVRAALARLEADVLRVQEYRDKTLPDLREWVKQMQTLFETNQPGVDFFRVMEMRRRLIQARDGYLDSLWAVRMAWADLLAAIGEPVLGLCVPTEP
jgi:outer membrane protein TolC